MSNILVIIPTFNEKDNVGGISRAVAQTEPNAHILFVDDSSPDGTGAVIQTLMNDDPHIHLLVREQKQGLGRAYIAGFKWALERDYEYIFEMDSDFSHNPASIPSFLRAAQKADLVLGTRYQDGVRVVNWPLKRLVLSMGASLYVRTITGLPFSDPTGGFKCFRREVLESIALDEMESNGYSFQIEMTHNAWMLGFQIAEVPITFDERRSGQSKMTYHIISEAVCIVWHLAIRARFRRKPQVSMHPKSILAVKEPPK
jgi:dolichol-phosphate mannosyltransferase